MLFATLTACLIINNVEDICHMSENIKNICYMLEMPVQYDKNVSNQIDESHSQVENES